MVIGTSTGGPRALLRLLSALPAGFRPGVVVAQHMPPGFTRLLAQRLDDTCTLTVREAEDGDEIGRGTVLVAPAGSQARVEKRGAKLRLRVEKGDASELHRPNIDRLLTSAATAGGARVVGVILTGMGGDGAEGLRAVREAGGRTFAESEETAVIYGMPRAAAASADLILPLDSLAQALAELGTSDRPLRPL